MFNLFYLVVCSFPCVGLKMTSGKLQFSIEVWVSPSSLLLWRYWLDNSYHTMSLPSTQNTPAQQLSIIELFHIHSVLATWQSLSNLAPSLQESPVRSDQIRADGKLSLPGVYCPPWPSFQAFVRFYPCSRSPQFLDNPVKPVRHYRSYTPSPLHLNQYMHWPLLILLFL